MTLHFIILALIAKLVIVCVGERIPLEWELFYKYLAYKGIYSIKFIIFDVTP